jgi:PPOX class probable F420-dependent enzyme
MLASGGTSALPYGMIEPPLDVEPPQASKAPNAPRRVRPRSGTRLPASGLEARLAARLAPRKARNVGLSQRDGTVQAVGDRKYALLVTYRRDGTPVPTPTWAAEKDGRLYIRSERESGKVKRLRRDPRVLVAPCTARGKPVGALLEATARVLPPEAEGDAEAALARCYGPVRALFEWIVDRMRVDMCYLEISPGPWPSSERASGVDA